jgi:hypothetical protein
MVFLHTNGILPKIYYDLNVQKKHHALRVPKPLKDPEVIFEPPTIEEVNEDIKPQPKTKNTKVSKGKR